MINFVITKRIMKRLLLSAWVLCSSAAFAQTENFDIATFIPPAGWQRESVDFAASYVTTNTKTGGWCRISVYKSIESSGDPIADFNSEWTALAEKDRAGMVKPNPESSTEEGWTAHTGAGKFQWQGKDAYVVLTTISGYGKVISIMVTNNGQEFMPEAERFLSSIKLTKPEGAPVQRQQTPMQYTISDAPGNQGISISTINFDDGWVAQPFADYVRVVKGPITVLLHYGIEITDELRNTGDVEGHLFDRLILPRYTVSNLRKYDNDGPCYFCIYFYEADVVEKSSGQKYHLGFRVVTASGVSRCIEIRSPSAAAFQQQFPTQEKVEAMLGYNKFEITLNDIVGTWESTSGAYVNMYNSITGAYAGMNTSSSSQTFTFNQDGTYNSRHVGAFGMIGSLTTYDQKYNGKLTVSNWDITMTNRWEGKTEVWLAQFEAVRGGRILHITDKNSPGVQYHLVKTK